MLSAAQVAQAAGVQLRRRGSREWACCPLHREKTPSMCFYPDGRFYCFGCQAHGDGADLYAALHGVGLKEALRAVGKELPQRGPSPGQRLRQQVEAWARAYRDDLCRELHAWNAYLDAMPEGELVWQAVQRREDLERALDELQDADPATLTRLWKEANQ